MPKWIKVKRLSAFTSLPYGGSPACVILGAENLTEQHMKQLAGDLNPMCDSSFVFPESTSEANIYLRFFTGSTEINFSGHAALATYFALSDENVLQLKEPETILKQRTKVGINTIELRVSGNKITRVTMTLSKPNYLDADVDPAMAARFLGLSQDDITATGLPFDVISTGLYDLIVPLKSLTEMRNITPNFSLMDSYCVRLGINGITAFCTDTFDASDNAFMRHFAPSSGTNEDVISAAAAGTLGCYLLKHKLVEEGNFSRVIIEQGYLQHKQGKVFVHIETTRRQIYRVKVGGNAVLTFTGYVLIP